MSDPNDLVSIASATVEHIWCPLEQMPSSLHRAYPNGACVVFVNEQLIAAIPATASQTLELGDLMEQAAMVRPVTADALRPYQQMRDKLCFPAHYIQLTAFFKQEMEKQKDREEGQRSRYLKMASAARNN